jgi:hypothetical protein
MMFKDEKLFREHLKDVSGVADAVHTIKDWHWLVEHLFLKISLRCSGFYHEFLLLIWDPLGLLWCLRFLLMLLDFNLGFRALNFNLILQLDEYLIRYLLMYFGFLFLLLLANDWQLACVLNELGKILIVNI